MSIQKYTNNINKFPVSHFRYGGQNIKKTIQKRNVFTKMKYSDMATMEITFSLLCKAQLRKAHKIGVGILITTDYFWFRVILYFVLFQKDLFRIISWALFWIKTYHLKEHLWPHLRSQKNFFRKVEDG